MTDRLHLATIIAAGEAVGRQYSSPEAVATYAWDVVAALEAEQERRRLAAVAARGGAPLPRPEPLAPSGGACDWCNGQRGHRRFFFWRDCAVCKGTGWLTAKQRTPPPAVALPKRRGEDFTACKELFARINATPPPPERDE